MPTPTTPPGDILLGDVVVYLKDGRTIDIGRRAAAVAIAELRALGVTPADIDRTEHWCRPAPERP